MPSKQLQFYIHRLLQLKQEELSFIKVGKLKCLLLGYSLPLGRSWHNFRLNRSDLHYSKLRTVYFVGSIPCFRQLITQFPASHPPLLYNQNALRQTVGGLATRLSCHTVLSNFLVIVGMEKCRKGEVSEWIVTPVFPTC